MRAREASVKAQFDVKIATLFAIPKANTAKCHSEVAVPLFEVSRVRLYHSFSITLNAMFKTFP